MNQKSLLAAVFVSTLAFTSIACDDDATPKRDAGMDRTPDLAVTEGGVDRALDTSTEVAADKAPDTTMTDAGADKAPDSTVDAPADGPAVDAAADKAPDLAVDLPPDTTPDLAPDTTPDTTADAMAMLNGCTSYEDRTAAGADRSITWDQSIATNAERCLKVKVGQAVTWVTTSFATHPLTSAGGDLPTPFPTWSAGTTGTLTFSTSGTFGYKCTVHGTMIGAIWVVP